MKRWWIIVGSLVVLGGIIVSVLLIAPKQIIPAAIASKLTSTLYVLPVKNVAAVRSSVRYDSSLKLLTYVVTTPSSTLTISEQPTPDSFTDVPAVYTKVISSMNGYQTFDSPVGTVDLTLPPSNGGDQTAVMNSRGTLMFIKSSKHLTQDQWQRLFLTITAQTP